MTDLGAETRRPQLSIVTSLYRSAPFVEEFHRRMVAATEKVVTSFEIVYVNDGSPDDALQRVLELAREDPRVVVVDLSRNFGHHLAFMAGLEHSRGERIFFIDVDLQEQPEWLERFDAEQRATGAEVVFGCQPARQGGLYRRFRGALFYWLFNLLSDITIPPNPCTVRLFSRRYADALLQLRDANLFLAGNYAWAGYRQVGLPVQKSERQGLSSYGPLRLLRLFVTAIASFTAAPLRLIFFFGVAISTVSLLLGLFFLLQKLLNPSHVVSGWASVMVSIWFLGGTIIMICGVLGIYLSMVFGETKNRPRYLVRAVVRAGAGGEAS
jgi:putative glycosyltransferase